MKSSIDDQMHVGELTFALPVNYTYTFTSDHLITMEATEHTIIRILGNGAVLDAAGSHSASLERQFFAIHSGELHMEDLTLKHGYTLPGSRGGGCLWLTGGSVAATRCAFEENSAGVPLDMQREYDPSTFGGAASIENGQFICLSCIFKGNTATEGGAVCVSGGNGLFAATSCIFVNNNG